jgi:hypothetical protein
MLQPILGSDNTSGLGSSEFAIIPLDNQYFIVAFTLKSTFLPLKQIESLSKLALIAILAFDASSLAGQFPDGRIFFESSPTLVNFFATFQSVRAWGAKYYLIIALPPSLGAPLGTVTIQQQPNIQTIAFLVDQTFAFLGDRNQRGENLTLKSTTFDPNTQTITVIFDPPVPPGNTVSIGLKPVQNPDYGGIYQFGITAYPPGDNSPGLALGVGRLTIYEAGDRW